MKKILISLLIILVILVIMAGVSMTENAKNIKEMKEQNQEYEKYMDKQVFGTEVITVINKATNANIKNEILKDEKGFFKTNNTNSIIVEVKMLNEGKQTSYPMETIQKVGVEGFIKNFNLITFKGSKIEYHQETKKVSKIIFEQIEE